MKGNHPQHLELVIQQVAHEQWAVFLWPLVEMEPLWSNYMTETWREKSRGKRKEGSGGPSTGEGERVMVSCCCWPTLCDNCFLVCGSAWQDARRQEPSSAGCIPAVARERRQPGRRVLLDWFYMGPSQSLVHLYPWLDQGRSSFMWSLSMCTYLFRLQKIGCWLLLIMDLIEIPVRGQTCIQSLRWSRAGRYGKTMITIYFFI